MGKYSHQRTAKRPVETRGSFLLPVKSRQSITMNTKFQPLTDQQCKEIDGGYSVTIGLLGIPVNLDLTNLNTIASSLGGSLVNVSAAVSGLLVNVGNTVGNLLGNLGR